LYNIKEEYIYIYVFAMKMERILKYNLGKEVAEYSFVCHNKSNLVPKEEIK